MNKITIELFEKQWQAFNSKKQYIAVVCGKQSGKTFLGSVWAQKKISEFPNKNGLIAAPTYKILSQSTLEKFFQLFPQYRNFYKQQQSVIELSTGGRIFVRSTDEPLGLEGMTLHWAWLDEAGMMQRLVWDIVRARTSINKGQVFLTSSPYNLGWFYQDFYLKFKNNQDDDLDFYTWRSVDSPYFSKEFYEKEKQRLSALEFAKQYEGLFTKMSGLVYDLSFDKIIKTTEIKSPDYVIAGVDWGFRNPTAIAVLFIKDKNFYLVDEYYQTEKTMNEILQEMKLLSQKHKITEWYPDPAEPDRIEEMKRAGFYVRNTNKDIMLGVSKIQQLLREGRFYVFETCKNTIDEFNCYHFDEENTSKDEPVKENDHLLDAIRYAVIGKLPYEDEVINSFNQQVIIRRLNQTQFE